MKKVHQKFDSKVWFPDFDIDGVTIEICISRDEINSLLAAYDPDDFNSPDIVTCRALARLILDALNS